jgi:hypothetical protein
MREVETDDPLLTVEDVALRLRVSKDWGLGPLIAEITLSARHSHERRCAALPGERDRRVSERAGTGLKFKAQAPVKWGRPLVPSTQKLRNKWESRTKKDRSGHEGPTFAQARGDSGSAEKRPSDLDRKNTTEGGEKKTVVPSRGKILLFAGKMRASNLEEVR